MKTFSAKPKDISKEWILIDAENTILGRLSSIAAKILRGKHKVYYTPHMDCGDNIIIINAKRVFLTGNKLQEKYYWHTGHPGGIKSQSKYSILSGNHPERILFLSIKRMLPSNRLRDKLMNNLRIYPLKKHPHTQKNITVLDLRLLNTKNNREVS